MLFQEKFKCLFLLSKAVFDHVFQPVAAAFGGPFELLVREVIPSYGQIDIDTFVIFGELIVGGVFEGLELDLNILDRLLYALSNLGCVHVFVHSRNRP